MTTGRLKIAVACLASLTATQFAAEYVGPSTSPATPTDTVVRPPRNAYETTPPLGVPYSTLFRDTGAPYLNTLRDFRLSPDAQLTESVEASGRMDLPDFRGRFPLLQRGFAPENADLKIGPLYFKLRHISAAALFSDNVNRTDNDRQSDWLGIVTVGGQVLAQLSEGFRIAAAGNFVYLPIDGEAGFTGFSLRAPYSFGIAANPSARTQVAWEPVVFGLPITLADEFTVGLARYSNRAYDGFDLFEGGDFDERETSGVHTLRVPRRGVSSGTFRDRPDRNEFEQLYQSNEVSLSTGGPLPGDRVFRLRASHTDYWYDDNRYRFPHNVDTVRFSIESNREDRRFKPFVSYRMLHRDDPDRFFHRVLGGIRGPITDLLSLHAAAGHSWVTSSDSGGFIWRVGLFHRPGPYTRQSIIYNRGTSDFLDEVRESLDYRFHKILGPDLTATAYAGYHWVEDIDGLNPDRTEFRTGLRLHYIISPKSSLSVIGQYAAIDYDDGLGGTENWRVRGEYRHRFLDRLTARLIYQHEHQSSDRRAQSFYENLFYFALSWYFD